MVTNELLTELHCLNGLLLLGLPVAAASWLLVQWRRQRQPGAAGRVMVFIVQIALIFQVFLGICAGPEPRAQAAVALRAGSAGLAAAGRRRLGRTAAARPAQPDLSAGAVGSSGTSCRYIFLACELKQTYDPRSPRQVDPAATGGSGCAKKLIIAAGALVGLILLATLALYLISELRLNRTFQGGTMIPYRFPWTRTNIARGQHLAQAVTGCQECHGRQLEGKILEDDAMLGQIVAPNLTAGKGGVGSYYSDADWVRFMRHGVDQDGRPLVLVSSLSLFDLGDADMAALIAYMRSLEPVDNELPETRVNLLARLLLLLEPSALPALVIDHRGRAADRTRSRLSAPSTASIWPGWPAPAAIRPTSAAESGPTTGRNLTPGGDLATWSETDFRRAIRFGMTTEQLRHAGQRHDALSTPGPDDQRRDPGHLALSAIAARDWFHADAGQLNRLSVPGTYHSAGHLDQLTSAPDR